MDTNKHIVVIDDEIKICDVISEILMEQGYKVSGFTNGYDALQFISRGPVDLIILDMCMPGINGVEFIKRLRNRNDPTPVIILTALKMENELRKQIESHIFALIEKPVELNRLIQNVNNAVSNGIIIT